MSHKVQWPPAPHPAARDYSECLAKFKVCEELRASPPTTTAAAARAAAALVGQNKPGSLPSSGGDAQGVQSAAAGSGHRCQAKIADKSAGSSLPYPGAYFTIVSGNSSSAASQQRARSPAANPFALSVPGPKLVKEVSNSLQACQQDGRTLASSTPSGNFLTTSALPGAHFKVVSSNATASLCLELSPPKTVGGSRSVSPSGFPSPGAYFKQVTEISPPGPEHQPQNPSQGQDCSTANPFSGTFLGKESSKTAKNAFLGLLRTPTSLYSPAPPVPPKPSAGVAEASGGKSAAGFRPSNFVVPSAISSLASARGTTIGGGGGGKETSLAEGRNPFCSEAFPHFSVSPSATGQQEVEKKEGKVQAEQAPEEEEGEVEEEEGEDEDDIFAGIKSLSQSLTLPSPSGAAGGEDLNITGRAQSKAGGYSRMWEDPSGDRSSIPLYSRLHFSTLPRKAVAKKTWYLVHNTYASLQNGNNGQPHHPTHHHVAHHHTNGTHRMDQEVGGGGGGLGLASTPGDEFRSHNHAERLMRKMETCAGKRQLCDVVLVAGGRRTPAHRLVLSAASDYFAAMFMNNVREASMEEVELKDVDPEALTALVQYMYTGRIELREDNVECLLSTACLLQLLEVVEACCGFLMKQLHPSNCIGIRQFADAQGCTDLYKVANNYVMETFVDVMHNAEFLMLPCEEVCQLLASDDLNVPNEETIFEALCKWARHDLSNRRKFLSKLLAHIKLPLMAPQYIADHVETNCLFREDRECQQLIMEALKYHLLPERRSSFQSPRTKPRKSTVGVLYAVGGMDCTKGATSIEKYELRTNSWMQVANMSGRRLQFGVAVLEDRLYVVGGRDGLKTLNTVECYDPKKKSWTIMPPMSTHRHGLGVGVLEGPMYAVGGHDGWSYLNTVERWDPQARQWSYVAPMSTARSTVGVASLHGKLYAVGGRDGSSCLKSVECFDPHTNKWTHCTPMAKRRGGVGVATCNGFLYAVGGHEAPATNPTGSRYDSAERYDPKTDQWTNISPISSPRDAVGLCPLGDKLFAVGGYDGQQYLNDVECYDPITNEWTKVSSLCTGRAGACVVHVPNS